MERIFVSYKRDDKEKVFLIKNYIEKSVGEQCWIDIDGIESDAQFEDVIISVINNAEIFLFMYSLSHTKIVDNKNDWTMREINYAKKRKRVVILNLDGAPLIDRLELRYGLHQQTDTSSNDAMKKLCEDLKRWLADYCNKYSCNMVYVLPQIGSVGSLVC